MALPDELLNDLGAIEGMVSQIGRVVNEVLDASRGDTSDLTVGSALEQVETVTQTWSTVMTDLEDRLTAHAEQAPEDRADATARIGGMSMLHIAVAADIALVRRLDDREPDSLVRDLDFGHANDVRARVSGDAAFGDGELVSSLRASDAHSPNNDPDPTVEEVVDDLIERGGRCGSAVVLGVTGGTHFLLQCVGSMLPMDLVNGFNAISERIARLVHRLIAHAVDLLAKMFNSYWPLAQAVIAPSNILDWAAEWSVGKLLGRVMRADQIKSTASAALCAASRNDQRARRTGLKSLRKKHKRWVGPVRVVAKGLPYLWGVPLGPVPAAIPAAFALLAWTVLITGDQLDAVHYPRIWHGVVDIANGRL